jgi:hypothetical protein
MNNRITQVHPLGTKATTKELKGNILVSAWSLDRARRPRVEGSLCHALCVFYVLKGYESLL